jgi:hypothetical protein
MTLGELIVRALNACEARGHNLAPFTRVSGRSTGREVWVAPCNRCDAVVAINTLPSPNEIDLSGNALSEECEGLPAADQQRYEEGADDEHD